MFHERGSTRECRPSLCNTASENSEDSEDSENSPPLRGEALGGGGDIVRQPPREQQYTAGSLRTRSFFMPAISARC